MTLQCDNSLIKVKCVKMKDPNGNKTRVLRLHTSSALPAELSGTLPTLYLWVSQLFALSSPLITSLYGDLSIAFSIHRNVHWTCFLGDC